VSTGEWSVIGWSLNWKKWSVERCSEVKCSWVIFFWLHSLSCYLCYYCYVFLLLCIFYYVMCSFVSLSILIVMCVPFCVFCLCCSMCCLCVNVHCTVLYCDQLLTQLQLTNNNNNNKREKAVTKRYKKIRRTLQWTKHSYSNDIQ
jgi:hypothetical protein